MWLATVAAFLGILTLLGFMTAWALVALTLRWVSAQR
ncbi:MAG: hypothetical protein R3F37_19880 [Candidatus Competibacteraceae bacterium]